MPHDPIATPTVSTSSSREPAFVHPTAVVDEGAVLEPGVKVWHFVHVSAGARVG